MGLLTFFRSFKTPEFPPGTVFYVAEDGEYRLYKILRFGPEGLFVKAFWPATVVPSTDNLQDFDLRNGCEAFHVAGLEHAVVVVHEPVTEEDEKNVAEFQRIDEGIRNRALHLETILKNAGELVQQERFAEAEALYTEAASFSKYYFQIFDQRGYCYLMLGRFPEAIADLEHSLSIFKEGKDSLYRCATAYFRNGNVPKALEKLEELLALDPHYDDGRAFLERLQTP